MNLEFVNQSKSKLPKTFLKQWINRVERELPSRDRRRLAGRALTVVFLSRAHMRRLNREYRGKDYATDVLSFSSSAVESGSTALGELAICPEVIKRQAREHDLTFQQELGYMVLHGILHLLGYDHELSKTAAVRMFRLQDRIFARLTR